MTTPMQPGAQPPTPVHWWGQDWTRQVYLIEEVIGDGAVLFAVQPLNTRPNYYLARVDSSVAAMDDDGLHDLAERVLELIEEECWVAWPDHGDDCPADCGDEHHEPWPALDDRVGWDFWIESHNQPQGQP